MRLQDRVALVTGGAAGIGVNLALGNNSTALNGSVSYGHDSTATGTDSTAIVLDKRSLGRQCFARSHAISDEATHSLCPAVLYIAVR